MKNIQDAKRIVFKVGTSTLTHQTGKLDLRKIELLCQTLSDLANAGREIILVTSAAISAGCAKLGIKERPKETSTKQAIAAVGQGELMRVYERYFGQFGHTIGQILITREEIETPSVRANAENTFERLINMGCIPVVNENDSMSSQEIEFGDNDTLSAVVADICSADALVILSDIDGLYDCDPHKNPNARLICEVDEITDEIRSYAGGAGTSRGTGGLVTKIRAAEICTAVGIPLYIINGADTKLIYDLLDGKKIGTKFKGKV